MLEQALLAMGFGLLGGSGLFIGAALGLVARWPQRIIAMVMAFGAGALMSALAFDLVAEGHERAGFLPIAAGILAGAALFVLANGALEARGGFLRKPATLLRYLRERRRKRAAGLLARLSRIEMIRSLPPDEVPGLIPFVDERHYRPGETIFAAGDPGDALYLIEAGSVEVRRRSDAAGVQAHGSGPDVVQLGTGEAFGELALLGAHPHHSTAVAVADTHLWRMSQDSLAMLEARSPRLAAAVDQLRARHRDVNAAGEPTTAVREPVHSPEEWHSEALEHLERRSPVGVLTAAEHEAEVKAHAGAGAPMAIFLGALLDGIPESVVIGASLLAGSVFSPVLVVAVFLSNLPEALASASGMRRHGFSAAKVLGLWAALMVACGLSAMVGNAALANAPRWLIAATQALAAGSILAMLADTMMPEAFEQGGTPVALWTALGFLAAFFLTTLGAHG